MSAVAAEVGWWWLVMYAGADGWALWVSDVEFETSLSCYSFSRELESEKRKRRDFPGASRNWMCVRRWIEAIMKGKGRAAKSCVGFSIHHTQSTPSSTCYFHRWTIPIHHFLPFSPPHTHLVSIDIRTHCSRHCRRRAATIFSLFDWGKCCSGLRCDLQANDVWASDK